MNWKDEPATESQLNRLRQLGRAPEHALTKGQAAHLITTYEGAPRPHPSWTEVDAVPHQRDEAYRLRMAVEQARQRVFASAQGGAHFEQALELALAQRQQFWVDTCQEPARMLARSEEIFELHMKLGCRFVAPTREQVQEILDALDIAMPVWDKEHPEIFYQTLELNFPDSGAASE